jgi:hypothetical protein
MRDESNRLRDLIYSSLISLPSEMADDKWQMKILSSMLMTKIIVSVFMKSSDRFRVGV